MIKAIETFENQETGFSAEVFTDINEENHPRNYGLWRIITHPDYTGDWNLPEDYLEDPIGYADWKYSESKLTVPIYFLGHHSSYEASYRAADENPFLPCEANMGIVGFAVISAEDFENEFGEDDNSEEHALKHLNFTMKRYTDWANRKVYRIRIKNSADEEIFRYNGIYGLLDVAERNAQHLLRDELFTN